MKSLMLRPIIDLKDGKLMKAGVQFGTRERVWKNFIKRFLTSFKLDDTIAIVNYVGLNKKDLELIKEEIEKRHKFNKIVFQQCSPTIAVKIGPGSFGIQVVEDKPV